MRTSHTTTISRIYVCAIVACMALWSGSATAATFFTSLGDWQAAAGAPQEVLDMFTAADVAKADEVVAPPSDTDILNTSSLTFSSGPAGISQDMVLSLLESPTFEFRTSGTQPGLEPSSNTAEDFQVTFSVGVSAFAIVVTEQQNASTMTLFNADDQPIDNANIPGSTSNSFLGVVSATTITRISVSHPNSPTDNFGIGTIRFVTADSAAIPEPTSIALLLLGGAATLRRRRRVATNA